jgi:dolichol kinase
MGNPRETLTHLLVSFTEFFLPSARRDKTNKDLERSLAAFCRQFFVYFSTMMYLLERRESFVQTVAIYVCACVCVCKRTPVRYVIYPWVATVIQG